MLCLLLVGRRKEREREREASGGFIPRAGDLTYLAGCARPDFHSC
jgi:hypothetical protein